MNAVVCIKCSKVPTNPRICRDCSKMCCSDCLTDTPNCPHCGRIVTESGMPKVRWFTDIAHVLSETNVDDSTKDKNLCNEHGLPLKLHCMQCCMEICQTCAKAHHHNHKLRLNGDKDEKFIAIKKKIEDQIKYVVTQQTKFSKILENLEKIKAHIANPGTMDTVLQADEISDKLSKLKVQIFRGFNPLFRLFLLKFHLKKKMRHNVTKVANDTDWIIESIPTEPFLQQFTKLKLTLIRKRGPADSYQVQVTVQNSRKQVYSVCNSIIKGLPSEPPIFVSLTELVTEGFIKNHYQWITIGFVIKPITSDAPLSPP